MQVHVKRRDRPAAGSIPDALQMFRAEVRFYQEIAPVVGVRVPACYRAEATDEGTLLLLEDLSEWRPGADPIEAAGLLAEMHRRWSGLADRRWPWLRRVGAASDLVAELYDRVWPDLAARSDLTGRVRALGDSLTGRVIDVERDLARAGRPTLIHGDASTANMRTGPEEEIALLDWEDVSAAPGALDLAWLLVSSVETERWADVIRAYGAAEGLAIALPAVAVQGLLSLAGVPEGSTEALGWVARLGQADLLL
jgi:Phosphotransferase enzyme family